MTVKIKLHASCSECGWSEEFQATLVGGILREDGLLILSSTEVERLQESARQVLQAKHQQAEGPCLHPIVFE